MAVVHPHESWCCSLYVNMCVFSCVVFSLSLSLLSFTLFLLKQNAIPNKEKIHLHLGVGACIFTFPTFLRLYEI